MASTSMKFKPERGKVVVVPEIPPCSWCGRPGIYDFATRMGPWANGCPEHYEAFRASPDLGVGTGQLWITEDQAAAS